MAVFSCFQPLQVKSGDDWTIAADCREFRRTLFWICRLL